MRLLVTSVLMLAALACFGQKPDSSQVGLLQIGPMLYTGLTFQRAAEGSRFDSRYFSFNKTYRSFGVGMRIKANLQNQFAFRVGYTYARRGHGFNQHNFDLPGKRAEVEVSLYNMAHELCLGLSRDFYLNNSHRISAGVGYTFNIHTYTLQRGGGEPANLDPSQNSAGKGTDFLMIHGGLGNQFNTHTLAAEIGYSPPVKGGYPIEVSLGYYHDLTAAPKIVAQSARLSDNHEVEQRFLGVMVPANSSVRLNLTWYLFNFGR